MERVGRSCGSAKERIDARRGRVQRMGGVVFVDG